jgi:hypothetical protein
MAASKRKEVVMRSKIYSLVFMVLALGLITAVVPNRALADEFKFNGPPAFTVVYPKGSKTVPNLDPANVWSIETPKTQGFVVRARVAPIPEGLELKDVTEKWLLLLLEKNSQTSARIIENKEITLSDGTKAYYSESTWRYYFKDIMANRPEYLFITTMHVSVFKDGRLVSVTASSWKKDDFDEAREIAKSLKFQ